MITLVYPRNSAGKVDGARCVKLRAAKNLKVNGRQRNHRARTNALKCFNFLNGRCSKKEMKFPFYP